MDPEQLQPEMLENLRRSIVMLPTGAPALKREDAVELIEELQRVQRKVLEFRRALNALAK